MAYSLGVDVGTTYTAAAVSDQSGTRVVGLAHDRYAIPSVVAPPIVGGGVLIGSAALTIAATEPDRVAREFKRRFGDPTPLLVGGEPWLPEALTGLLLRAVVDKVIDEMGSIPTEVVLTHPATWREHRLDLLRAMVETIELENCRFISEPVAAAINYHDRQRTTDRPVRDGALVAVYDLGGGTFDAAMLELSGQTYEIRGEPEGLGFLGGIDFDLAVLDVVKEKAAEALAGVDLADPQTELALARLRQECTLAKEVLSQERSAIVPVVLPGTTDRVVVQRSEFEDRIEDLVEQTVDALERSMHSAGLEVGTDADSVLLVGGSSRVPLVATRLGERLGVQVLVDTHPKQAVALGAAMATKPLTVGKPAPLTVDIEMVSEAAVEPTVLPPMTVAVSDFHEAFAERYLLALNGPMSGTAMVLTDESTTIGRLASSDSIGLNDQQVSRRHFEITKDAEGVTIRDLESTNGTWVDGRQVHGSLKLEPGSIIEVGSTLLLLEAPFFTLPAPDMIAQSWSLPPFVTDSGLTARFSNRKAGQHWLASLEPHLGELAATVETVRRSRRVFRPNGPRTLAWFENSPERVFPRETEDEQYGSVTLGHGPRPTLLDLSVPVGLRGNDATQLRTMLTPFLIDPWVPIPVSIVGATVTIDIPPRDGKALLRSMLYEFVHFHPNEPVVLFGIDPATEEWSFLQSGSCTIGDPSQLEHDGLVVSYAAGRVASVRISTRGDERGSSGTLRVGTLVETLGEDDSAIIATDEPGVFRLLQPGQPSLNFIPATLPAGRVPTTKPVP